MLACTLEGRGSRSCQPGAVMLRRPGPRPLTTTSRLPVTGAEGTPASWGTDARGFCLSQSKASLGFLMGHRLLKPRSKLSPGLGGSYSQAQLHDHLLATPSSQILLLPFAASLYANQFGLVTNAGHTMSMSPLVFPDHSQHVFLYNPLIPLEETPEFL